MFNFFRKLDRQMFPGIQHNEYAEETLANARREFLVASDQMEYWEAMKTYRAKQIERLEKYVQENDAHGSASATTIHVHANNSNYSKYAVPIHSQVFTGGA